MKRSHILAAVVAASALAASAIALRPFGASSEVPSPFRLVQRVPFELLNAGVQDWRLESPSYTSGDLVVLEAHDIDLVPVDTLSPVLLCGAEPIQRLNRASSGFLVGIVPHCDDTHTTAIGPFYFGSSVLPEQLALATTRADLQSALALGLRPLGADTLDAVTDEPRVFEDTNELEIFASDLIERWAFDEADTVRGLRGVR